MIPTPLLAYLLLIDAVIFGASSRYDWLWPIATMLLSAIAAFMIVDVIRLFRGIRLDVKRICDEKLSLGAENSICLRIRNISHAPIRGIIRDEYPEGFSTSGNVSPFQLGPRAEADIIYNLIPHKRGDYLFGDIYIRLLGRFGLAMRQIRIASEQNVKVYPNLLDIRKYEISIRRRQPIQHGLRISRMRGRGVDFESLRDYIPDDEFRTIDWKASARRGKLITRQYQEEKSQNVLILLDCGRVMGSVISGLTRLDHAINAAMMLAHAAAIKGDRVGMIAFDNDIISYSPPRTGKSQAISLLRLAYNLKDASGESNYYRAVSYLSRKWTRRSLVVFFTELIDPESSKPLISQISSLTKKHLCLCVSMTDPDIIKAAGTLPKNPEDAYLIASARQVMHARKLAAAALARAGAIVMDVLPEKFTPSLIDEYLKIKSKSQL